MQLHPLKPLEQADMKLTLLNRLNDVFNNAHPAWPLSTDDIREILLLYLSITTNERWCLSKIVSHAGNRKVTGVRHLTGHLHTGLHTPCPEEETPL